MKTNEKYPVDFIGGHIEICAPGQFDDREGKPVNFSSRVDLSSIVDAKGRCNPKVFLNLVNEVTKDKKALECLKELAQPAI